MKKVFVSLCLILASLSSAEERRPLQVGDEIPVADLILYTLLMPVKCDPDQNIYLQLADSKSFLAGPVIRISSDGKTVVRYEIRTVQALEGTSIVDFAPSPRQDLYALARQPDGKDYLVHFTRDGKYDWHKPLESTLDNEHWEGMQIGVFGTGDLLIAGVRTKQSTAGSWSAAFVGLFDSAGHLLREISLPGDTNLRTPPSVVGSSGAAAAARQKRDDALSFTNVELGDDGYLYLTRTAAGGPVYRLAPSGKLLQTLRLSPPEGATLSAVKVGKGRVVAEFIRKSKNSSSVTEVLLQVVDNMTGERYAEYEHTSARIGSALASYQPDVFTFLAVDSSKGAIALVRVH